MKKNRQNTKTGFIGRILLFILLSCCIENGYAQIYPVQVTAQLAPPFSGYISDYTTPGNQNLKLLVLFSDFTKPTYSIKLKIKISGQGITIQSKNTFYSQAFSVQPGIPLEISGSDLTELLNTNNLDFSGISIKQYEEKKTLPEGFYNICFTAYDNNNPTQIQVSNESCAAGWMVLSDPPFLNMPMCGSTVKIIDPQNVFFQWTPMNMSSPNSAMNTVYDFELYEVKPAAQSPGNIIQTLPPIYKIETPLTVLNYGMTEPQLYPGMEYVWRVRAHDLSGRDLFKNQGYSQICTFTYGNKFNAIDSSALKLNLKGNALSYRMIKYTWDSLAIFSSYELEYRKQGGTNWFPVYSGTNITVVNNLETQSTYEAHVRGVAQEGTGPWSNTVSVTTPPKPIIVCGQSSAPPSMDGFKPLVAGKKGQVWTVGQFDMLVTRLESENSPSGSYSGYGKIEIPFLLGLNLNGKFSNILMNEEMVMVQGEITIVSDGIEVFTKILDNQINIDTTFNGDIDSMYVDPTGKIVIIDKDGSKTELTPDKLPYVIQDSNGNTYTIGTDGKIVKQTGIPTVVLTDDQKNVYKEALKKLKAENSESKLAELKTDQEQKSKAFDDYLTTTLGVDVQKVPATNSSDDDVILIPLDETGSSKEISEESDFKKAEYEYLLARVCRSFSKSTLIEADYNLLANYIIINEKKSHIYIAEQLKAGKSVDELAEVVKEEIRRFIAVILTENTFGKHN
ncbi:MAG TPA: fibronectin type III domain-containing protein [Bacteroidia bacterium]|nr:fibronectin type III domain-containing protein [Bacteroidia bacterium]